MGEFINFAEIGGKYAMCIIGLGGMDDIGRLWLRLMWSSKGAVSLFGMFMLD